MPHRLSVSRAARLAGVSRAVLQSKIGKGDLPTFEGEVLPKDLLKVFPNIDLNSNSELERVTRIKDNAFGKRIRERVLPNPEILIARLRAATKAHAITKMQLARAKRIIENLDVLYTDKLNKKNGGTQEISRQVLEKVKNFLLDKIHDTDTDQELAPIMAKNEILNIMTGYVKLQPSGKEFFVSGNDSILEAALGAGINLNWGCSNGNCGLCKARLISGKTEKIAHHDFHLKEADRNDNSILMCCHTPVTNIEIYAEELGLSTIPSQKIKCKVKKINYISSDILELTLQTPRSKRMRFFAGQSVDLLYEPGDSREIRRSLPIASCPCDDRNIQFHIRYKDNDEFATFINQALKPGDSLTIEGPEGSFIYDEDSEGTVLFIAANTGFAPVQGLIEHAMAVDNATSIELLRIQDTAEKPYLDNRCRSWADALDELVYEVVPGIKDAPDKIDQVIADLQPTQIFVAGPEASLAVLKKHTNLSTRNTKFLSVSPTGYLEAV